MSTSTKSVYVRLYVCGRRQGLADLTKRPQSFRDLIRFRSGLPKLAVGLEYLEKKRKNVYFESSRDLVGSNAVG